MSMLHTDFFVFGVFALASLLVYHFIQQLRAKAQKSVRIVFTLHEVTALLNPPESASIQQILSARAIPNARLVRAFGITNTFVTDDADVHRAFTREARSILATVTPNDCHWHDLARLASATVDKYIAQSHNPSFSAFTVFARTVTFQMVVSSLFKVDPDVLNHDDVDFVTRGINELWGLSMTTTTFPPGLLDEINSRLRRWIPQYPNPIDFVVPTYETMWRLIATSLALLHKDASARHVLDDFLKNPVRRQFSLYPPHGPSAEAIIKEVMRLHPPTRGIFRAIQVPALPFLPPPLKHAFTRTVIRAAEIGFLQRDQSIWGANADSFDPLRHHPKRCTELQQKTLLGFGFGSLKCVASSWAPHAAGIFVAAILERVGEDFDIIEGPMIGAREGWDGWRLDFKDGGVTDEKMQRSL